MRRIPPLSTLIVALAVAAMLALGVWQFERREEKRAALARYAANLTLPPIAFPGNAGDQRLLFRRAATRCVQVTGWHRQGGRSRTGAQGWRQIATCRLPQGTLLAIDMGVARDPLFRPDWAGGAVSGTLTHAPDPRPLIVTVFSHTPPALMLVADQPAPGLEATARPALSSVPNNHLAYAVQWFLFAGVAVIIYVLALRLRARGAPQPGLR